MMAEGPRARGMLGDLGQPATSGAGRVRGRVDEHRSAAHHVAERMERDDTTWDRRVRSAVLLGGLVTVLGVLAAATLAVLAVALTSLVDQALG